ncbi:hypothetical protein TVAG_186240 [Trichomonas vaginalis G3]|uniref:Uncharacterized protein n=1 Tax=Trichomonas vaginalis (strain ATCC PRA-98 / G3) TaxID=412133 RepID=A2D8R7_TRIV3|nr:leucine-rich repeats (6 copies)-containing protein [Trichomonas vaginalis G3]EAY23316.1 hypothetical protein TVAG_186240 [Trichomonas vaginalis G3]KAI5534032.1 leucine-rich repeats (6 copies)-containing protein [Trichomonas vaginalis G3]|eukprot:XP_001584302.1 hypothetical protein [Trichomonas vaginalis G3]
MTIITEFITGENSFQNVTNVTIVFYGMHDIRTPSTRENFRGVPGSVYVPCCYKSPRFVKVRPFNMTSCDGLFNCFSYNKASSSVRYSALAAMYFARTDDD